MTTGHHSVFGTAAKRLAVETDSTFARLLDSIHLPFPTDVVLSMIARGEGVDAAILSFQAPPLPLMMTLF